MADRKNMDLETAESAKKAEKRTKPRKKKKYGGVVFTVFMILYAAVIIGGACYGLNFLWDYMAAYEASRPENTVNAYMENLTADYVVDQCDAILDRVDLNLQSEETCREIMRGELKNGIRHAKKIKECTDTKLVYVLKSGNRVIGEFTVEANEPDQYGFTSWRVSGEAFDMSYLVGEKKSVVAPDACTVTVNGIALDESYVIGEPIRYEAVAEYYDRYEFPVRLTYEAGPLLGDFEMVITDAEGQIRTFDENTNWEEFYLNCTDAELKEMEDFADVFLQCYVDFTGSNKHTREATYQALIKHVVKDSNLAGRLKSAIAGLQFGQSKGDEIVSITPHLQIRLDDKYLIDLTYEVDTTGKEGVVRQTLNARILMVRTENGLKVESIDFY
jgi:hypothetical protein